MRPPFSKTVSIPEEWLEQCPFWRSRHILKNFAKGYQRNHPFYCDTLMVPELCYITEGMKRLLQRSQKEPSDGTMHGDL